MQSTNRVGADQPRQNDATQVGSVARHLAEHHSISVQAHNVGWLPKRLDNADALLQSAYRHFTRAADGKAILSYAAEWILDNFYLALRAIHLVREEIPDRYYRQLPKLEDGKPRIYSVASEIIQISTAQLDIETIRHFVESYQEISPLSIGELWALPAMLRLGILECLAHVAARSTATREPSNPTIFTWSSRSDDDIVANAVLSLRFLAAQDWKVFFESVSQIEQILGIDSIYSRMDFETRDLYRKAVEEIARETDHSETEIAASTVTLVQNHSHAQSSLSPRLRHVGYYLIDKGRAQLENYLGYQPRWKARWRRVILRYPTVIYLGGITLLALLAILAVFSYARSIGATMGQLVAITLLVFVPAVTIAVTFANWLVTRLISPRGLPKLDFKDGVPAECSTIVVIPALLSSDPELDALLQQLELHFLSNADPNLAFALLTDFTDAPHQHMAGDNDLLAQAAIGVQTLNEKYGQQGSPFFFFHRERRWNSAEGVWMGWERKRGKLEEFNRLLLNQGDTSYIRKVGNLSLLDRFRYVITLDADTVLPSGSARRLVGTFAHPLNRPEFDPDTGRVIAGYTVLQPRTEVKPESANRSWFARIFAGDAGLDLYTRSVSDVYQDLFGEGIYVGKGIYNVVAFGRSLAGWIPDNRLLSHDLFEGVYGRAGLVTDVVFFEDYPTSYLNYTHRLHRWIRGDWQLLPWVIFPNLGGPLSLIDQWKILDNVRRSLLAPALLALFLAGWLWLPGSPLGWTLIGLGALAAPLLASILNNISRGTWLGASFRTHWLRELLALVFLPYEAALTLHAIIITVIRLAITRSNLLEWTTAAQSAQLLNSRSLLPFWRRMIVTPIAGVFVLLIVSIFKPEAVPTAASFVLAWLVSPQIAYWISRPITHRPVRLPEDQLQRLRMLARRTWLYFEQFAGPSDHWLPPDHFHEAPHTVVAHRTSPTNIGLMLLSAFAAHDFGYIGPQRLAHLLQNIFEGMDSLERYRGHFLNWYDTQTLKPLSPRYVSTVDSGNLAGCLIALRQGCLDVLITPILRWQQWEGLLDTLAVFAEVLEPLGNIAETVHLKTHLRRMRDEVLVHRHCPDAWIPLLLKLLSEDWQRFGELLVELVESGVSGVDAAMLRNIRLWSERVNYQLHSHQRGLNDLLPWVVMFAQPPELFTAESNPAITTAWKALSDALPATISLVELPDICERAGAQLTQLMQTLDLHTQGSSQDACDWCSRLGEQLHATRARAISLIDMLRDSHERAETYVREMAFNFLFDEQRQLFRIGYNVDTERLDPNYYDLLMSEARIASLIAIARGDVPQSHWLHLGRPLTRLENSQVLLSWSGTMFEYLMPRLLMRDYEGTLLWQSARAAVAEQMRYGDKMAVPWGVSESGYYQFDASMNYQYRAFGVPELGLKRGLDADQVITPYASILALPVDPKAVAANFERLSKINMLGSFGLYEAVDYTPSRVPMGDDSAIVRSFMAHHQGMILVSLVNFLRDDIMTHRFHADPSIRSVELLLQERIPRNVPSEKLPVEETAALRKVEPGVAATPWRVAVHTPFPHAHTLSNGRYTSFVTSAGSGFSRWREIDLTRWRADTTLDDWGVWIYIHDLDSRALWSVGYQPTAAPAESREVVFYPYKADFRSRNHEILARMEITIPPEDDVEIRLITLTNQSDHRRSLRLTSYGEVVLAPQGTDRRHPAFNNMFVESEYLSNLNALLFCRRPRSSEQASIFLMHTLVMKSAHPPKGTYESDRARFLGRGQTARTPAALTRGGMRLNGMTGSTLDPVMAMGQEVTIEPHTSIQLAFVTAVADARDKAVNLIGRYQNWTMVERAFRRARVYSERELHRLELTSGDLEQIQRLLALLFYPHSALRTDPSVIAANIKGQSGLWPFAISGDFPILLVRLAAEDEMPLLLMLLRAHLYWRSRGIQVDLVILNEQESGYGQEVRGQIHRLLTRTDNDIWLNRRGGIFLLRADQMSEADRILVASAARVILTGQQGTLAAQLERIDEQPSYLPAFVPILSAPEGYEPTPPVPRPDNLLFDNRLGGFSPDGSEYLIYLRPGEWTPTPWINVITNSQFGFLVSEAGSGNSWAVNSGENRLTSWRNDPVSDSPAEALYLRDEETGEIWSPTPLPAPENAPYLIRHGAGYTIFEHYSHGLKQKLRLYAAPDAPVKIIHLRLENTWNRARRITATYYAEWVLGPHRDLMQQYIVSEYDDESCALLARNPYNVEFGERVAFLATSKRPHSLTGDRAEFLGRMGFVGRPAALERIGLAGTVRAGLDPCAAMQLHVDLPPLGVEEVYFLLGEGDNRDHSIRLVKQYQSPNEVEGAWQAVHALWDKLLNAVTVQTPDPAMNLLLNRWLLYQNLACRLWGRSALYQSSGAYGFRDQLQDVMALAHAAPELARQHILRAAHYQFEEGDVLHWWHPPSGRGVRTRFSDDLIWLPFVTAHYVTSTGDRSILDEKIPFLKAPSLKVGEEERYGSYETTTEIYTLYEHCCRALEQGLTSGPHDLPLIGTGDWNDGMNRVGHEGHGESVWLGWFLCAALTQFAPICETIGDSRQAEKYLEQAYRLRQAIEANGWDGSWYRRAYYDDGWPLGSARNRECQIDSIAQSWAVLSGDYNPERAAQAMEAVHQRLVKLQDQMILLFTPPFDKTPRDPGYIKGYAPGIRENGGQYTHAALWAVWAFAELGQGDRAEELFRVLNPIYHADTPEKVMRYRVEPYVVAADVYSVPPHVGQGGWTWYTGSAGWMYRLGIEAILGLRREGDKLRIDPCIPRHWPEYKIEYRYGSASYHIQIVNPNGVNRGVQQITLDGQPLPDTQVPLVDDSQQHQVYVILG